MKKYLSLLLSYLALSTAVFAAVGSNLDSVTVGSYLYPKTTGLPLGSSTLKWAGWLDSINGTATADAVLPSGGSSIDYLTGSRTWANLTTSAVTEGSRLYYTDARARAAFSGTAPIAYSSGVFSCDVASGSQPGCLSAANWTTFNSKEPAISSGATTTYYRGDKSFVTLDTSVVPENGNQYYTDARARAAFSGTAPISVSAGGVVAIADGSSTVAGAVTTSAQGIAGEKTFESPIVLKESATPSNPPALKHKIYPKSDGKLYRLNSSGTETEIGGGGASAGYSWQGHIYTDGTNWTFSGSNGAMSSVANTLTTELNNGMGTITAGGATVAGFTFTPPRTGYVEYTFHFGVYDAGANVNLFSLYDETSRVGGNLQYGSGQVFPMALVGHYAVTSGVAKTVKVQMTGSSTAVIYQGKLWVSVKYVD